MIKSLHLYSLIIKKIKLGSSWIVIIENNFDYDKSISIHRFVVIMYNYTIIAYYMCLHASPILF